jgi:RNA polymerase sigma factor (sigma-70 family)
MSSEAGDRRRWVTELLDEHEAPLTRFARRLTGDDHAAMDVVQHAFLRLCEQSPEELRGREAQWLFTVCRNRATDLLRRRGRHEPLGEKAAELPEPRPSDPAELTERDELHQRLSTLVDDLPLAQREVLLLWLEGFRNAQIAEMTDHREGHVRVLVHRAIKQLRNCREVRELIEEQPTP